MTAKVLVKCMELDRKRAAMLHFAVTCLCCLVGESCRAMQVFHTPMSAKVLVERMELVRHLVDEAQRLAPDRITFRWSHPCQVATCASQSPIEAAF